MPCLILLKKNLLCIEMAQVVDNPLARVGARVLILTHRATVRYIGSVAGQEGVWVGVEYDDPARGKHDGITGGVRYFTTASSAASGSFVRLEKVDFGCSVPSALAARYSNQRGELGDAAAEQMYVRTATNRRVHIEVVGVDQIQELQSKTHRLVSARLVGAGISHVGDANVLSAAGVNLTELDLTGNLLAQWQDIAAPLQAALTGLKVLNFSDNPMVWPLGPPAPSDILPGLRALVLNDCRITWREVVELQPRLPQLQELHLSGNGIQSLASDAGSCQALTLEVLSLDDNLIVDWSDVVRELGALPRLRILNLSQNPLTSLTGSRTAFTSLEAMFLAGCQLSSWQDIDALDLFTNLKDLRLTGNPVITTAKGGGRFEVLGRVGHLTMLNGAAVGQRERNDSELRYLQELRTKCGDVLITGSASSANNSIAASMLNVRITCVAATSTAKMGSQEKKLPRTTQLQAVRLLCEKLFKVKVADQLLYLKSPGDPIPQDITTEDDSVSLGALGFQESYEVLLDQKG